MTDRISLRGIRVFAHHGVYDEEQERGQIFLVDVDVEIDLAAAGASDDLADTLDYGRLAEEIASRASGERWDLIERVAERTADLVLEDDRVAAVDVTVHKPEVVLPVPVAGVSVSISRRR